MARTQTVLFVLGLAVLGAAPAQAQLGFYFGGNFDQLTDIDTNPATRFGDAQGYHVGVFYDLARGPVGLRVGALYVDAGEFEVDVEGVPCATPEGCPERAFDIALLAVPVDLRVRLASAPFVRPYVLVGPVFRYAVTGDEAFEESLNDFSYAGNAGLGLEIGTPGGFTLYPELRLGFGLSSITDGFEFLGVTFAADEKQDQYLNAWMLRLGVSF